MSISGLKENGGKRRFNEAKQDTISSGNLTISFFLKSNSDGTY